MDPRLTKPLAQKARYGLRASVSRVAIAHKLHLHLLEHRRIEAELNKVETKIYELESKLLSDRSGNLVIGLEGFSG